MRSIYATGEARPVVNTSPFAGMPHVLIEELDACEGDPDWKEHRKSRDTGRSK